MSAERYLALGPKSIMCHNEQSCYITITCSAARPFIDTQQAVRRLHASVSTMLCHQCTQTAIDAFQQTAQSCRHNLKHILLTD